MEDKSSAFVPNLASTKAVGQPKSRINPSSSLAGLTASSALVTLPKDVTTVSSAPKLATMLQRQPVGDSGFGGAPAAGKGEKMIVWFRADLRLHDHPALRYAMEHGSNVLPLFTFDPRQFGKTSFGFAKTGRYRAEFLIEAVSQLRKRLRSIDSDLIVREGRPEDVILELCKQHGIKKVIYHKEVCFEEQEVEQKLSKALKANRVEEVPLWSNTLYDIDDLPFGIEKMPDVYSQFRDMVQSRGKIQEPLEAPKKLPALIKCEAGKLPTLKDLGLESEMKRRGKSERFVGGEIDAMNKLDKYINDAKACKKDGTTPSHLGADFSCKISPWLALGCVSPRRIHQELKKQKVVPEVSRSTTYFELVWRDFFRYITLKYGAARLKSANQVEATKVGSEGVKTQMFQTPAVAAQ